MPFSENNFVFDGTEHKFRDTRTGEESDKTTFFVRREGDRLKFRFCCREDYFCPRHFGYNEPLYDGDIVELMITLGDKSRYLEIESNQNGADYCVIIDNRDGEGEITITPIEKNLVESRVEILADGWSCDIILNISDLKKIGFVTPFFFNAHRQDYDRDGYLNLYSLRPTFCDTFHKISAFAAVRIKEDI